MMLLLEPCSKIDDYIKEVEICHEDDIEMSPESEEAKNSNSQSERNDSPGQNSNEFETPQRKRRRYHENKSDSPSNEKPQNSDCKFVSNSKTEPLNSKPIDQISVGDEFLLAKQYFTSRKIKKSIKITHLNSLSAIIGQIGRDEID